ncbi:ANM_HP_G0211580.mRNA.1.CDS.1 [Saccharomyces cerevisiae]|nr:ANM_HP_G0211580.mRNA.1.CDS.1 [Saccharomyces cerevisiae]CAI6971416.1 ANM_HP_G0211580.mRNA.1.CDS.1 [Saccharomyces cerevisiae]
MVEHDKSGSKRQELRSNMRNLITLNKGDIITATYDPVSLDPAETLIEIIRYYRQQRNYKPHQWS